MTKIVCLSDTHNQLGEVDVPDSDILIHCGDWTGSGTLSEVFRFRTQIKALPHKVKLIVAGNHDWYAQRNPDLTKEIFSEIGAIYLQDESVVIDGLKVYGSPWTPRFFDWAFLLDRGEPLARKWANIPDDTNVLISHGPAFGILDLTQGGEHVGCEELRKRVFELTQLKLHCSGHIHSGYGVVQHNDVTFVNASICTERYKPTNKPIVLEI